MILNKGEPISVKVGRTRARLCRVVAEFPRCCIEKLHRMIVPSGRFLTSMPRLLMSHVPVAAALALASATWTVLPAHAQVPCMNEVNAARAPVETTGKAVKAAIDAKKGPEEICSRLKTFTAAEAKFIKYLEDNASWCGFPPDALNQVKQSHVHSLKLRGQACKVAAAPRALPAGPRLADALGTSRPVAAPSNSKPSGIFGTLSGNSLQQ